MITIAEISGADSIAAALAFAESHPGVRLVPTYVGTGTEFGDFSQIEANVAFLRDELPRRGAILDGELLRFADPTLWRALNGAPASRLAERFGRWLPCVGCHLYLHLMRIPIARTLGAEAIVSGEREQHDGRIKANQLPEVLDAYTRVIGSAGVELALPIRTVGAGSAIDELLGVRWPGGSPQLECVLKGNERSADGSCITALPDGLVAEYIEPAGIAIAAEIVCGGRDWTARIDDVLSRPAPPARP